MSRIFTTIRFPLSGRLTVRNRRFLRQVEPFQEELKKPMVEVEEPTVTQRSDRLRKKGEEGGVRTV